MAIQAQSAENLLRFAVASGRLRFNGAVCALVYRLRFAAVAIERKVRFYPAGMPPSAQQDLPQVAAAGKWSGVFAD